MSESAAAAERVDPDAPLPDLERLTIPQWQTRACARCAVRLFRSVRLGRVRDRSGQLRELWVCPKCATPAELAAKHAAGRSR